MPTEIWTWSEVDSIVLTTSNYFSNLWKDCISDSTGVSDCKGIPSMLALNCKYNVSKNLRTRHGDNLKQGTKSF